MPVAGIGFSAPFGILALLDDAADALGASIAVTSSAAVTRTKGRRALPRPAERATMFPPCTAHPRERAGGQILHGVPRDSRHPAPRYDTDGRSSRGNARKNACAALNT